MKNANFLRTALAWYEKKPMRIWFIAALGILILGLTITYATFRQGVDFGDGSTFYSFARNIAQGEEIYDEFIHFRTPGSYFLQALFMTLFGESASVINLELKFEAHVLYPIILFIALGILFRWRKLGLSLLIVLAAMFLPGYLQVRAALALLAIVVYIRTLSESRSPKEGWWLFAAGALVGFTFIFGQETALLAAAVVGVAELYVAYKKRIGISQFFRRLGILAVGLLAGLLPLLVYAVGWSQLSTMAYYTIYYAFVLQPQGMDVDFPGIGHRTFIYLLPFIVFILSAVILFLSRKKNELAIAVLFGFAAVRMATFLGRTDMGHLIFVLPELILIVLLALTRIRDVAINKSSIRKVVLLVAALTLVFVAAVNVSSMCLVVIAPIMLFAFGGSVEKKPMYSVGLQMTLVALVAATIAVGAYLMYPQYAAVIRGVKQGLTGSYAHDKVLYEGSYIAPEQAQEVAEMQGAIEKHAPSTIFSFPIQPFYYRFANEHGARFMTYEPQTTTEEQEQTITDLKRTKPEVVVFDPLQAIALSGSVSKISDYILETYEITHVYKGQKILWVMVPGEKPEGRKLVFDSHVNNTSAQVVGVQNYEKGTINALLQMGDTVEFNDIAGHEYRALTLGLVGTADDYVCGKIKVTASKDTVLDVCSTDPSPIVIDLPKDVTSVEFIKTSTSPLIWNDVTIR